MSGAHAAIAGWGPARTRVLRSRSQRKCSSYNGEKKHGSHNTRLE